MVNALSYICNESDRCAAGEMKYIGEYMLSTFKYILSPIDGIHFAGGLTDTHIYDKYGGT